MIDSWLTAPWNRPSHSVPPAFQDGDFRLVPHRWLAGEHALANVPALMFRLYYQRQYAGAFDLRFGQNKDIRWWCGHIGYGIEPAFRCRGFAQQGVRMLQPYAQAANLWPLWITTNPENTASQKVCSGVGAHLIEKCHVPSWHELYARGDFFKLRYLWAPPKLDKVQKNIASNESLLSHRLN